MKKFRNLKLFGLVSILVVALFFIGINVVQAQVQINKGKKPKPPPPPPLEIHDINIATWDFGNTLRIWHLNPDPVMNGFSEQWSKENCDYLTMEFGDANNDGSKDLITTGISTEGKGRNKVSYNYFEVYENGATSDPSFVSENVPINSWKYNVNARVVDIDANPSNEIVFMTSAMIKIYRLEKIEGTTTCVELASSGYQDDFVFMDLDVADLDGDEIPELVVCTLQGFIRIFKIDLNSDPIKLEIWHDTDNLGPSYYWDYTLIREVRAANLVGDNNGYMEILCSTDDSLESYLPHLLVFKFKEEKYSLIYKQPVYGVDENTHFQFDVGDLEGNDKVDEVVLGTYCNSPYEKFEVWQWNQNQEDFKFNVDYSGFSGVMTRTVTISDADGDSDLEVVISGSVYAEGKKDRNLFYLEVFDWNCETNFLDSLWNFKRTHTTVRHHNVG